MHLDAKLCPHLPFTISMRADKKMKNKNLDVTSTTTLLQKKDLEEPP
jgi:hypothetical protein